MTTEPLARTDEERHYYALNAKAWRLLAPFYDAIVFPVRRMRHRVARLAEVNPGMRVLDVATGTGKQAFAFADAGADVVGIDLSESMLRIARRKAGARRITFQEADARALPFAEASFERSSVSFGLHEMPSTVRREALLELARVTRPDGRIVLVDYALPRGRIARWLVYHVVKFFEGHTYAEFVTSDLRAMLEDAGITVMTDTRADVRWWRPIVTLIARKR